MVNIDLQAIAQGAHGIEQFALRLELALNKMAEGEDEREEGEYEGEDAVSNSSDHHDPVSNVSHEVQQQPEDYAWDDTDLIDAWDAAVREYQVYHSSGSPVGGSNPRKRSRKVVRDNGRLAETAEPSSSLSAAQNNASNQAQQEAQHLHNHTPGTSVTQDAACPSCGSATLPSPPTVLPEDKDLANAMMSWYYAGYYTGIYTAKNGAK
ncbi:hypothetical protein DFS34DRAFT_591364 [Phlyctochytrium arcticum]|nr:hypothetical protein DFS34DRAFT_591364 [Phlyctochytrium arcticum]